MSKTKIVFAALYRILEPNLNYNNSRHVIIQLIVNYHHYLPTSELILTNTQRGCGCGCGYGRRRHKPITCPQTAGSPSI